MTRAKKKETREGEKKRGRAVRAAVLLNGTRRDVVCGNLYAETKKPRDISEIVMRNANFARVFATGARTHGRPECVPKCIRGKSSLARRAVVASR